MKKNRKYNSVLSLVWHTSDSLLFKLRVTWNILLKRIINKW